MMCGAGDPLKKMEGFIYNQYNRGSNMLPSWLYYNKVAHSTRGPQNISTNTSNGPNCFCKK